MKLLSNTGLKMNLNPKMQPIFDCLKTKLQCTEDGIQDLKTKGKLNYFDILTIKYYFNNEGQVRFKVKQSDTKDGVIYTHEGISFKPVKITNKNVKRFEKVLSKFLEDYAIVLDDC